MTALQRKKKTENYLKKLGIPFNLALPVIEEEAEATIRTGPDIAKRILVLTYLGVYSEDEERDETISFFQSEALWDAVSAYEKQLLLKKKLTNKDKINISWRSEAILILLWAINKAEDPGLPTDQVDIGTMLEVLPLACDSTKAFVSTAITRSTEAILNMSDLIYRLHWAVRQAELNNQDTSADIDPGIIQEWHYAINWITYYDEEWDDILTDT